MKFLKFILTVVVVAGLSITGTRFYQMYEMEKQSYNTLPDILKNSPYASMVKEDMVELIEKKEQEIQSLQAEITNLKIDKTELLEKNKVLEEKKATYETFQEEKKAWNKSLAYENPDLYIKHYEEIAPEQAANIYKSLQATNVLNEKEKELYKMLGDLEVEKAADVLEKLLAEDQALAKKILLNLTKSKRNALLNEMSVENVSKTIKLLEEDLKKK